MLIRNWDLCLQLYNSDEEVTRAKYRICIFQLFHPIETTNVKTPKNVKKSSLVLTFAVAIVTLVIEVNRPIRMISVRCRQKISDTITRTDRCS